MVGKDSGLLHRYIRIAQIATGVFFVFFGEYKVASGAFAHGGFAHYLDSYIQQTAVSFYRPVLAHLVLPHAIFFGYMVGVVELFIGISMIFGIFVRAGSAVGALHMISLTLATWWEPGHGVPFWRYFGAELDHLPLLLLFVIFFAASADRKRAEGPRRS